MSKKYLIHDNGGRPFKVVIEKNKIKIFNNKTNKNIITIKKFIDVFIGKDNDCDLGCDIYCENNSVGNSILIKINKHKYISVGWDIYYFKTKDEIHYLKTPIASNDVPEPYAIGDKNIYLLAEKVFFNKNCFNPYRIFYRHGVNIEEIKIKMIQKRL